MRNPIQNDEKNSSAATKSARATLWGLSVVIIWAMGCGVGEEGADLHREPSVLPAANTKLRRLIANYKSFRGLKVGSRYVYHAKRRIGNAVVMSERERVVLDGKTGRVIKRTNNFSRRFPKALPAIISLNKAMAIVRNNVSQRLKVRSVTAEKSALRFIRANSSINPFNLVESHPHWHVRVDSGTSLDTFVVDAVSGKIVGTAIRPPVAGLSAYDAEVPGWRPWAHNGEYWLDKFAFISGPYGVANLSLYEKRVKNPLYEWFYTLAHGGSFYFLLGGEIVLSPKINDWRNGESVKLAFLGHCEGMCDTGSGSLSDAWRQGSNSNSLTVGYCGMSGDPCSVDCWGSTADFDADHDGKNAPGSLSILFQEEYFRRLSNGKVPTRAFVEAVFAVPGCFGCFRQAGDIGRNPMNYR